MQSNLKCNLCGGQNSKVVSIVDRKPALETDYLIPSEAYYREIHFCLSCHAYFNFYDFDLLSKDFYQGFYNSAIETGKLIERFKKIIELPIDKSDNKQRVKRIIDFLQTLPDFNLSEIELLDVGTGTGVFVHEAKKFITNVSCVDPDAKSIDLVRRNVAVNDAWVGTIERVPENRVFDVITYNKVLEHVSDPIQLLTSTATRLKTGGIFYIELPYSDWIIASQEQDARAEFFIEHLTVYNKDSLTFLIGQSGLKLLQLNTIVEPSGKHTIYAFCRKAELCIDR